MIPTDSSFLYFFFVPEFPFFTFSLFLYHHLLPCQLEMISADSCLCIFCTSIPFFFPTFFMSSNWPSYNVPPRDSSTLTPLANICRHLFLFCFILCILFIFTAFLHILYRPISLLIISLHTTLLHSPCEVLPADFPFSFLSYFVQHRELFPCGEL